MNDLFLFLIPDIAELGRGSQKCHCRPAFSPSKSRFFRSLLLQTPIINTCRSCCSPRISFPHRLLALGAQAQARLFPVSYREDIILPLLTPEQAPLQYIWGAAGFEDPSYSY